MNEQQQTVSPLAKMLGLGPRARTGPGVEDPAPSTRRSRRAQRRTLRSITPKKALATSQHACGAVFAARTTRKAIEKRKRHEEGCPVRGHGLRPLRPKPNRLQKQVVKNTRANLMRRLRAAEASA